MDGRCLPDGKMYFRGVNEWQKRQALARTLRPKLEAVHHLKFDNKIEACMQPCIHSVNVG
jgi:hypothetical protein